MKSRTTTTTIVHVVCRLGVLVRILILCLLLRYISNLFYMHNGLMELLQITTTTSINGSIFSSIDPPTISIQQQKQIVTTTTSLHERNSNNNTTNQIQQRSVTTAATTIQLVDTTTWAKPSDTYIVNTTDLWENKKLQDQQILPNWMIQYFRWHKEQRKTLDEWENDEYGESSSSQKQPSPKPKYLYVTCFKEYHKCGGAADRLLSIPFLLKVAASTQRILLIRWTKPAPLEAFLVPPRGGLDWRVIDDPDSILFTTQQQQQDRTRSLSNEATIDDVIKAGTEELILQYSKQSNVTVVQVKFQSHDHGSIYYDTYKESSDEANYDTVFHTVWNILFTPSAELANTIRTTMGTLQLQPGQYTAAHVRALYGVNTRDDAMVQGWTQNAINCAIQLQQQQQQQQQQQPKWVNIEMPMVYFAADSSVALKHSKTYCDNYMVDVKRLESKLGQNPLHLDKTPKWELRPPSDFYDVFIDLYIMGFSSGVAYGMGGYGKFASLLLPPPAYHDTNVNSSIVHMSATHLQRCKQPPRRKRLYRTHRYSKNNNKIVVQEEDVKSSITFIEPMPIPKKNHERQVYVIEQKLQPYNQEPAVALFPDMQSPRLPNIWEESKKLPNWMKEYFTWHKEQRKEISEHNWEQHKYIIMVCLFGDKKCGGTSDRLRPLPVVVRIAAQAKRIILILWEKPAPLESFLLPPIGGVDWRVPSWMIEHIRAKGVPASTISRLVDVSAGKDTFINARVQSNDHGSEYYNKIGDNGGEGPMALRQHYRDCWYSFFTPVSAIAKAIETEMDRMNLIPDEFAIAHLRSQHDLQPGRNRDPKLLKNWTINALNCVSSLRPGGPYFFSSDTSEAKRIAMDYGTQRGVKIVSSSEKYQPIHLDMYSSKMDPKLFYSIFVDLYIMSFGRCFTFNVGGFSKWANLISGHDFTCNLRYWTDGVSLTTSVGKDGCQWTNAKQNVVNEQKKPRPRPLFLPPLDIQMQASLSIK